MIVKAIYTPNFGDKTTGKTYEEQIKRYPGDIFECDDELAKERIRKGFVKKATKEEIKEYENTILKQNDIVENESINYEEMTDEQLIQLATEKAIRIDEEKFNRDEVIEILKNPISKD